MAECMAALTLREEPLKDVRSSKLVQDPGVAIFLHQAPVEIQHHQVFSGHPANLSGAM